MIRAIAVNFRCRGRFQRVTGACVAIRRAVFLEAGGFDEINLQVGFDDIDLCLRLRNLGYRVVWTPFAELFHVESVSRGYDDFKELFSAGVGLARLRGSRSTEARKRTARVAVYAQNLGRDAGVRGSFPQSEFAF